MTALIALVLAQAASTDDPGYQQLVNGAAVTCGMPLVLWSQVTPKATPSFAGRLGPNATLDDSYTAVRAPSSVDVVAPNCLECHAGRLLGKKVLGLGNSFLNHTGNPVPTALWARNYLPDGPVRRELDRFLRPLAATAPHITTDTVGVSAADDLAATLMAHRDPHTLAWRAPSPPLPARTAPVPVDVPAWWLARDKGQVFATGLGTGRRATLMASAALLCADSVEDAQRTIDAFGPVPAYVDRLEPPKWPWPIDAELAAEGLAVYQGTCAGCHDHPQVIPVRDVGTDPLLWERTAHDAKSRIEWFNASVYGETAKLEATAGYVAQPLRGVWATAPYFHNGAVPTLAAVLDRAARPTRWSRSMDSRDYDAVHVGWRFTKEATRTGARVYDTTRPGYGNQGHTYGDSLSRGERLALLEYLKTL